MKNAPLYTRRTKKLFAQLKRESAKPAAAPAEPVDTADATRVLLLGVFCNHGPESKATAALDKLMAAMVDLNDLRVTPVSEIVEIAGVGFPHCRRAAEEVSQVLASIFNRIHDLDLSFLRGLGKKSAAAFINSLDGLSGHASAFFKQRHLGMHLIPLDVNMFAYLIKGEFIAERTAVAEAQRFCAGLVKDRDGPGFYSLFKRYAATHSPPKIAKKKTAKKKVAKKKATKKKVAKKKVAKKKVAAKASPKKAASPSTKKPVKKPATKKATARPSVPKAPAKKSAAKKAPPKKPASKKSAAKKQPAKKSAAKRAKK